MRFQLAALSVMVAGATAFTNVASPSNTATTSMQLQMTPQENQHAPLSLLAAGIIMTSAATATTMMPAPADAKTIPTKEEVTKMAGPQKDYYNLVSKMDLSKRSIEAYTQEIKTAKAAATELTKKTIPEAKTAIVRAETTLASAEESYSIAKAAPRGEFSKAELKQLQGRVAAAKAAVKAAQTNFADLSSSLVANGKSVVSYEQAVVKAKASTKELDKKLVTSKKNLDKYNKKQAEIRRQKEKVIQQEEKALRALIDSSKKAEGQMKKYEKDMLSELKKAQAEQKKIDTLKAAL